MVPFLSECFHLADPVPPEAMDRFWSGGWRHFGGTFFRYSILERESGPDIILPLRLDLSRFEPSKSQRRNLRKNADLTVSVGPAAISPEAEAMFERHKTRFVDNIPDSLELFLGPRPGDMPCRCLELRCHLQDELVAMSFLDVGACGTSSVYGMFEPAHSRRGLGIFTLLQEIEWSRRSGMIHYYPGYATRGPGFYDYKKQFRGLESLDWADGAWRPLPC